MSLPEQPKINVFITKESQGVVVRLRGEISVVEADILKNELLRVLSMRPKRVVFDLTDLSFISSPGMGVFASFRRSVVNSKGRVFLTNIPEKLATPLRLAGLNQLYEVCGTVEEALNKP